MKELQRPLKPAYESQYRRGLTCPHRSPRALRHAPIYAFQQHGQLSRCDVDLTFNRMGPDKASALQTFGK